MGMCKKRMAGCEVNPASKLATSRDGLDPLLPGLPGWDEKQSRFFELVTFAMPGLEESAARIARAFPVGRTSACAMAISSATAGAGLERWPGMRDEIATGHPVAVALSKAAGDERYPVPCDDNVRALSAVAGFRITGQVCSIDGVAVPAERSQLVFLVHARWRALFHPMAKVHEVYAGNSVYDRVMTTDHIQRQLWGFGVFEFVRYLEAILSKSAELFVALWLRRWEDIDRLTSQAGSRGGPPLSEIFGTPALLTLKSGDRDSFLAPWAIMSEIERVVEIANQMRARRGITSAAVRAHVAGYRTIDDLMADESEIGEHIRGLLLSLRFVHHTMNGSDQTFSDTDLLARLKSSVACSDALQTSFRRVECPNGEAPALLMNGLDLARFIPASLHQIWLGLADQTGPQDCRQILRDTVKRIKREMWLSIVILANICPPTAQSLTAKLMRKVPVQLAAGEKRKYVKIVRNEPGWLIVYPTAMILTDGAYDADRHDGPAIMAFVKAKFVKQAERIEDLLLTLPDSFKNILKKNVTSAIDSASRIGKPGWTRGAYHRAWFEPEAEVEFLRKCSNFILYDEKLDHVAKGFDYLSGPAAQRSSGKFVPQPKRRLPLAHPLENVQQIFRPQFHVLQIPEIIPSAEVQQQADRKFAILQQAARRFAAWSPTNFDPGLAERIGSLPAGGKEKPKFAWALSKSEISHSKDWSWQRDWDSCGRI